MHATKIIESLVFNNLPIFIITIAVFFTKYESTIIR